MRDFLTISAVFYFVMYVCFEADVTEEKLEERAAKRSLDSSFTAQSIGGGIAVELVRQFKQLTPPSSSSAVVSSAPVELADSAPELLGIVSFSAEGENNGDAINMADTVDQYLSHSQSFPSAGGSIYICISLSLARSHAYAQVLGLPLLRGVSYSVLSLRDRFTLDPHTRSVSLRSYVAGTGGPVTAATDPIEIRSYCSADC